MLMDCHVVDWDHDENKQQLQKYLYKNIFTVAYAVKLILVLDPKDSTD